MPPQSHSPNIIPYAAMSHGFKIDFSCWDVKPARGKLMCWAEGFFDDVVWLNDQQLLGWFCGSHTPPGMRQLIHNNLTYWKCTKSKRRQCGWVLPLSADEFRALAGRVPKPVHEMNVQIVTDILGDILSKASEIGHNRVKARKEIRDDELKCYAKVFNAMRANTPCVCKRDAEVLQCKIANLRGHLQLLSKLRDENPNLGLYLFPGWENKTPQEYLENRMQRGFKRRWNETFARKHEERREAAILQELETRLEALIGDELVG